MGPQLSVSVRVAFVILLKLVILNLFQDNTPAMTVILNLFVLCTPLAPGYRLTIYSRSN
jgi:hypothetical protein